jgi:hypothetical protein
MPLAYYNFCRRTRLPGKSARYRLPAATATGIVDELRDFERFFDEVTERTCGQRKAA